MSSQKKPCSSWLSLWCWALATQLDLTDLLQSSTVQGKSWTNPITPAVLGLAFSRLRCSQDIVWQSVAALCVPFAVLCMGNSHPVEMINIGVLSVFWPRWAVHHNRVCFRVHITNFLCAVDCLQMAQLLPVLRAAAREYGTRSVYQI